MKNEEMNDADRLRNPLCIRWNDDEHRALTDAAWRLRIHASELVRQFVAEGMAKLQADEGLNKGAENKAGMP